MVYSAIYLPHNKRVAIKVIDLDMFERNQIDELRRETALMALSKHPHVLRVYGSFVHGSKLYIVTPYMAVGSCLDIMKLSFPDGIDEISIATILKQALEGLAYLHKNGHIHRDVKAGNLLMDQDGSVLLADFGVSSSLMETGERGVRKTFVGTPCWMAPEVMEQADYDYKADIWSFGITAIELATGHAPFAKHPPLKVLMMTLNNDPPTLSRETNTNKFSRTFKEMIDTCMCKDPAKRPSADKLLLHPFFKQAKKPEWLAKNLIADIPPIESRPIKKFPQKQVASSSTDEWDFNDEAAAGASHPQIPGLNPPKRHISFGHVVVRKPSSSSQHQASESWSYSSSSFSDNNAPSVPSPPSNTNHSPPPRKGRALSDDFLIEASRIAHSKHYNHSGDDAAKQKEEGCKPNGKLLYRTISHEDNMNRKSRFNTQQSSPPPPAHLQALPLSRNNSNVSSGTAALTRENSAHSKGGDISESRKIGRFELTNNSETTSRQHSYIEGNREISPYSTAHSSSSSSLARGQKSIPAVYNQINELLRQNDSQKQLLSELVSMFELPRTTTEQSKSHQELVSTISVTDEIEYHLNVGKFATEEQASQLT
ncbi:kinase-like domain-containing protein [Parasitella parasitica]|nr:kinase-like domain-containing protein [Parasitella parasitica]